MNIRLTPCFQVGRIRGKSAEQLAKTPEIARLIREQGIVSIYLSIACLSTSSLPFHYVVMLVVFNSVA